MQAQVRGLRVTSPPGQMRILGISGSARKGSYNTSLLMEARASMPAGVELRIFDTSTLPLYNQDLDHDLPAQVKEFKREIRSADSVLFATPEHNYTIPALLKNAIEWGDRPEEDNSWDGKPAAIMSASTSARGGARAQLDLRKIMVDINMYPMNRPQVIVAMAEEKFDSASKLTDEKVRQRVRELVLALVAWTMKMRPEGPGT